MHLWAYSHLLNIISMAKERKKITLTQTACFCNDAKARKIGYKHKKVHARNTLEREEAKEKERATKKRNPYFHNPNGGDA